MHISKYNLFKSALYYLLLSITLVMLLSSCLNKAGYNLGKGLIRATDGVGSKLITEVSDEISADSTQEKFQVFLDGISTNLKKNLNEEALGAIRTDTIGLNFMKGIQNGIADSLMLAKIDKLLKFLSENGTTSLDELIEGATSEVNKQKIADFLSGIITKSLNEGTKKQLNALTKGVLDSLLSDAGASRLREQLLGQATKDSLNSLLDSAMSIVISRINKDLSLPRVNQQLNFIQKWAKELLLLLGLITFGIIAFVWSKRTRYLKLIQLLTNQINQMPNESAYDELTHRIQEVAREHDYEKTIRQILKENGMLGEDDWKQHEKKASG